MLQKRDKLGYFSAIGAVSEAEIGFYDLNEKAYHFKKFDEDLEICAVTGNVSLFEGRPTIHAHGTLANKEMKAFGGHLKSAVVGGTCELLLVPIKRELIRKLDEDTGLKLLT